MLGHMNNLHGVSWCSYIFPVLCCVVCGLSSLGLLLYDALFVWCEYIETGAV